MPSGAEEIRDATAPSSVGTGKLKSPWWVLVSVLELDMAGSGGLLDAVAELVPLLEEDPPLAAMPSEELVQCGSRPGIPGGVSKRPCSNRRSTLHVAAVSECAAERSSASFPWSFFCFVRRFWNHTFTCTQTGERGLNI